MIYYCKNICYFINQITLFYWFAALQSKTFYFNHIPTIIISGNEFELGSNKLTAHGPLSEEILIQVYLHLIDVCYN